jgi:hypothetical protein
MTLITSITDDRRMAYRQHSNLPIRYRVRRTAASERIAAAENISHLGVFFGTDQEVVIGTPIEILMEMPKAITGSALKWYGRGRVVRVDPLDALTALRGIAVQFSCYEILPTNNHFLLEDWRLSA